ncbi:MAG: leucyl aminopeptidase [Patescibacteria group bacterium]|nr:leucyl aminopeptidase [Patescibacteria group bacterium]MBU2260225.1 leucyl aminopeptidase [Patescibacteria group bacterium]
MKTVFAAKVTTNDKLLIVPVFQKDKKTKYPKDIDEVIKTQTKGKHFEGKDEEMNVVYGKNKILLVGLGEKKKLDATKVREVFGSAVKKAEKSVSVLVIPDLKKYGQEVGEGLGLGSYNFAKYKTGEKAQEIKKKELREIRIIGELKDFKKGLAIAESVNYVKDLVIGPSNIVTSEYLANEAKKIGKKNGYKVQVFERKQIEKLKMGGLLAVNNGSRDKHQQARFAILEYKGGKAKDAPIVLVGKGLIFDTGGLNLKPGKAIVDMQQDMAGGAAVLGVFDLLKKLNIKKNVVGLIPITENNIDADAFRPNDVITMYNGKTVEVLNTDAEGRLIIADGLSYGVKKYKPKYIIDIATLTGACLIALGDRYTGLFGNDEKLKKALDKAGKETDDLVWEMPIHKDHKKIVEGKIADIRNAEDGYQAAACTAAAFLENFVDKAHWAHLDIAGTAYTSNPKKYETQKATGVGIRLLVKFLES